MTIDVYLTEDSAISEPHNPPNNEFYVAQIQCLADFETLNQ